MIDNNNRIISIRNDTKIYNKNNELIAIAIREHNLLKMSIVENDSSIQANLTTKSTRIDLIKKWHRSLGYVDLKYLHLLRKNKLLKGIPKELDPRFIKYKICIENKTFNLPFKHQRTRAMELLEIVM